MKEHVAWIIGLIGRNYLEVFMYVDCLMHVFRRHTEPTSWGPYQKKSKPSHKKTPDAQNLESKNSKIACACATEDIKNVIILYEALGFSEDISCFLLCISWIKFYYRLTCSDCACNS
jgi:hypothetical protein